MLLLLRIACIGANYGEAQVCRARRCTALYVMSGVRQKVEAFLVADVQHARSVMQD